MFALRPSGHGDSASDSREIDLDNQGAQESANWFTGLFDEVCSPWPSHCSRHHLFRLCWLVDVAVVIAIVLRQAKAAAKNQAIGEDVVQQARDRVDQLMNGSGCDVSETPEAAGSHDLSAERVNGVVRKKDVKSFDVEYLKGLLELDSGSTQNDSSELRPIHWAVAYCNMIPTWPHSWRSKIDFMRAVELNKWDRRPTVQRSFPIPSWDAVRKTLLKVPALEAMKKLNLKVDDRPYYITQSLVGLDAAYFRQTYRRLDNRPMEQSGLMHKSDEGSLSIIEYARQSGSPSLASLELSRLPRLRKKKKSADAAAAATEAASNGAVNAVDAENATQPDNQEALSGTNTGAAIIEPDVKDSISMSLTPAEAAQTDDSGDGDVGVEPEDGDDPDTASHHDSALGREPSPGNVVVETVPEAAKDTHRNADGGTPITSTGDVDDVTTAPPSANEFSSNQQVQVQLDGTDEFVRARIDQVNDDGTYAVNYESGDAEPNVAAARIRNVPEPEFSKGDRVEANYNGEGAFYAGEIGNVNDDGTYNINYNDGDSEVNVPAERVRKPPPAPDSSITYEPRQRIEANFNGEGAFYSGVIEVVNSDGTYNIKYDDGDSETNVPPARIRPVVSETTIDDEGGATKASAAAASDTPEPKTTLDASEVPKADLGQTASSINDGTREEASFATTTATRSNPSEHGSVQSVDVDPAADEGAAPLTDAEDSSISRIEAVSTAGLSLSDNGASTMAATTIVVDTAVPTAEKELVDAEPKDVQEASDEAGEPASDNGEPRQDTASSPGAASDSYGEFSDHDDVGVAAGESRNNSDTEAGDANFEYSTDTASGDDA